MTRTRMLAAVVGLVASGCAGLSPYKTGVTAETDHYTKVERIEVGLGMIHRHADLRGGLGLSVSTTSRRPDLAVLTFKSFTDTEAGWRYLKCESVDLMADGTPYRVAVLRDSSMGRTNPGLPTMMTEYLVGTLPWESAVKAMQAKSLDVRLCHTDVRGVKVRPDLAAAFIRKHDAMVARLESAGGGAVGAPAANGGADVEAQGRGAAPAVDNASVDSDGDRRGR